jgi:organic radical activating enzyme
LEEAQRLGAEGDPKPLYVEVNFNQACNFKCSYCSPQVSSSWAQEIREKGPYQLAGISHHHPSFFKDNELMPLTTQNNVYVEAFWKWWPELYPTLKFFRMTGGEPIMDRNTFRVLEYIAAHPKTDLELAITSNCNPPAELWKKFMDSLLKVTNSHSIKTMTLFCSLDSWGKQAEYIRNGLDFNQLKTNITDYLSQVEKPILNFIVTFNNLSVTGWRNYLEGILELRRQFKNEDKSIYFDTPMLRKPEWQSLQILPPRYLEIMKADLAFMEKNQSNEGSEIPGFSDVELARMRRLIAWMEEGVCGDKLLRDRANFFLFFREHDHRRGTRFLESFPEMEDFWNLCKSSYAIVRSSGMTKTSEP